MEIHGKKIIVAMSGGVDSSVSAALLKSAGAKVSGVFMLLAQPEGEEQVEQVRQVADFLGISLQLIDLRQDFRREVLDYFAESYRCGRTPNPCVVCNHRIKFGALLDRLDPDALLATGHYARVSVDTAGLFQLHLGLDPKKDQSYFLSRLGQKQLARLCFPLGERTKEEVYRIAADLGLAGRHGNESQDVCFLKDQSVGDFLAGFCDQPEPSGPIVTSREGREIGRHRGLSRYTVGQRRGLGLPDATPWYVLGLDAGKNQVLVGKEEELYRDRLQLSGIHWISGRAPQLPMSCEVRIRYRHRAVSAELSEGAKGRLLVRFAEAQRAVTPGQFAVLSLGETLLGSGEIED